MKYVANLMVAAALVALVVAAHSQQPQTGAQGESETERDVKALHTWVQRYCDTVTAGDFEGYRAFWTEDVVWLPPNSPVLKGIEACMEFNRPLFEYYESVETMSAEEVGVIGDFAFVRVNYTYEGTPKAGIDVEPIKEDGKGVFLLRRKPDGSWVSTHCVWNSNLPIEEARGTQ